MDFLEYSDISAEVKGSMVPGRLKMTDQNIIFKNSKTGKVEQISSNDMELVNFQRFVGNWGLRIFLKNGILHRFGGFKDGEQEKVAKFFKSNYSKDMLEKELSLKGWNWGTAKFTGSALSFDIGSRTAFEIPLHNVSQCNTGKNEITLEFHQNDDTPVSLMEMRFHIPTSEMAGDLDPVEAFHQQVMNKASVISVSGDAIAIFRELQCLTPRGRYDIKIFQSFFQLHGKTYDYKIPMSTVLRLFLLPHKDSRQMFFVVSLDPPIKQGQTRYHFLVLLFGKEEEITIELPFSEKELQDKYEGKITKELSGPTYEVLGKIMKVIINRKLTGPGNFVGHSGTSAVSCSYKAAAGLLYPLEKGFINVHKPPIHIRFEEIASVNFARSGGSTRSFDFEIELKSGTIHTFSSIEKEEYGKLFDFISSKKLHVKNTGKTDKQSYKDDFGDSDAENEPDAYLARVKAEAKERDEDDGEGGGGGGEDSEESTDEDFNPNVQDSDVAEEYDSNHQETESESEEGGGGGSDAGSGGEKKKKKKKHKSAKTVPEGATRKPRTTKKKGKKDKDANAPKRAPTAFMLWLNETRKDILKEDPTMKVTEVAKRAGELWREMEAKDKSKWEEKAGKAKEEYTKAMKEYKESGGGATVAADTKESKGGPSKPKKKKTAEVIAGRTSGGGGDFKSKEYISDSGSSDEDKKKDKKGKEKDDSKDKKKKEKEKEKEKKESSAGEEEEEEEDGDDDGSAAPSSAGEEEESGAASDALSD